MAQFFERPELPLDGTNNLDVALDLARRNLAVFPVCDWGDGDGWKPISAFKERASTDPATIRDWWRKWPDARVALLCGACNGISVIDVDEKNGSSGSATLAALGFPDLAAMSPVRVRTPSGGWHLFFRFEPRVRNWIGEQFLGRGLDIRTQGAFVIAPGSFKDGRIYQPEGAPLGSVDLPAWPEELLPVPKVERAPVEVVTEASDDQRAWAARYLYRLACKLAATPEGERNSKLSCAALWAGGVGAHGFLTEDQAEEVLLWAAEEAGLPEHEAARCFNRSWCIGLDNPISDFPREYTADDFDDLPEIDETNSRKQGSIGEAL